jgi:membrane-bound metal-dependent hydrolase YbcI (DUF457 family)
MPFTPYHFGPSGFIGLALRKWIDVPVFILANVVVDVEVLAVMFFRLGPPYHRYGHTLLIGGIVGAIWGAAAYRLRPLFEEIMGALHIPYRPRFRTMVISGVLGVWLHVLIDGAYHHDVKVFWPSKTQWLWATAMSHVSKGQIRMICLGFFVAAFIPYALAVVSYGKRSRLKPKRR